MSYPILNTKAGDVVVRNSTRAPSVYLVAQILADGEQFNARPEMILGIRNADAKARLLLVPGCTAYLAFDEGGWIEMVSD